jgi:hypothetical protein
MAGAAAFDPFAKVTEVIETVDLIHEVTAAVVKLESELSLIRLSIAASSAALHAVNDKVNELREGVESMDARLSKGYSLSDPS